MQRIDELFTAWPFLGSRRMTAMLKAEGLQVNRKRVQRLMRKMGIARWDRSRTRQSGRRATRFIPISAQHDDRPAEPGVGG
ncbi:transposase [Bradyrhizobium diazoefficiens]|nr:IS3 family transposase [Bradyrhizobium diazoefficiens]MBK3662762.1 transposase [Bradyrhizobium diazoefficiens]